jgi:hypothetical protein
VLKYLSDTLKVQFHVNQRALAEAGIGVDTPVSISLKEVTASTVLRLVLQSTDVALDFVERDGFILVSTVEDLDRVTEVRVYPMAPGMEGSSGGLGGGLLAEDSPRSRLMGLIMDSVESDSWAEVGGAGSISEFNGLLVVKQSARVHEKVEDLLNMLRKAADLESAEE